MKRNIWIVLTFIPLISYAAPSHEQAWNAYLSGDFNRVEQIVSNAMSDTSQSSEELARLYLALGCADAMRGRKAAATASFEQALRLFPNLNLGSSDLPPPVWEVYQPVMIRMLEELDANTSPKPETLKSKITRDTLLVYKPVFFSRTSVIKSLVLPGWGHINEGKSYGKWIMAAEAVLVTGWLITAHQSNLAREKYLKEKNEERIPSLYERYDRYYRLTWVFGSSAIGLYLSAQFDLFSRPQR